MAAEADIFALIEDTINQANQAENAMTRTMTRLQKLKNMVSQLSLVLAERGQKIQELQAALDAVNAPPSGPVNNVANITGPGTGTVTEDGVLVVSGKLTIFDPDQGESAFKAVTTAAASVKGFGSYTLAADGSWAYTLNNNHVAIAALNDGQIETDSFVAESLDGSATKTITISIAGHTDVIAPPPPAPSPDPVIPPPPPPPAPEIDAVLVDSIATESGNWRIWRLFEFEDTVAYRWTLDENPSWKRLVLVRQLSAVVLTTLVEKTVIVDGVTMSVAPGAMRVWQNGSPVPFRWDWLKQSVVDRHTAGIASPPVPKVYKVLVVPTLFAYDPTKISTAANGAAPTSSINSVGFTSGQGGEYDASRGFYHNYDAHALLLAQNNAGTSAMATFLERITLDQLSHPQAAPWSTANNGLADPQLPYAGDTAWVGPYPGASVPSAPNWGRDTQHLENSAWAHWLATADPIAGLCIQRQMAYMLASHHSVWRDKTGRYSYPAGIERVNWNALCAAWKARHVARRINATGKTLYDKARAEKMLDDMVWYTDEKVCKPIYAQGTPSTLSLTTGNTNDTLPVALYSAKVAGALFHNYNLNGASYRPNADGTKTWFTGGPDFMTGQYGGVILPLLVREGNATATAWAEYTARHLIARLKLGYRGVEGTEELRGSMVAYGPAVFETRVSAWGPKEQAWPAMPEADYAAWLATINLGPTTNFNGAGAHTVTQMRNMLIGLKVAGLLIDQSVIDEIDALMAATTSWYYELRAKHLGILS